MIVIYEAKQDEINLRNFAGDELADKFMSMRKKFKSPYNDIYYWIKNKDVDDLEEFLNGYESNSDKVKADKSGADLIYRDNTWKVYHINTYEASVYYGKNTQWCISGSKRWSNGENGRLYFNDYRDKGVEFYFYIKSDGEKYALALYKGGRYEIFNQMDYHIKGITNAPSIKGLPDISIHEFEIMYYTLIKYNGANSEVTIPDGVGRIGESAFYGRLKLTSITMPDSVRTIENSAFYNCENLKSITISKELTRIGYYAFYGCESLTSITIPDGVTDIGDSAFEDCTSLTRIAIPYGVMGISDSTFAGCESLTSVIIPDGVRSIDRRAFYYCTSLESITIPDSVTSIGWNVFYNCTNLKSISIPNSVTYIGDSAFEDCTNLKSIIIPDSVRHIGHNAFYGCDNATIYCSKGSFAEEYCIDNNINYVAK